MADEIRNDALDVGNENGSDESGKELTADFGTDKPAPRAQEAEEAPVKAQETQKKTAGRKKVK